MRVHMRIFFAALSGGVAMFLWSAFAHMVLPLGEAGLQEIPNNIAVMETMQQQIGARSGLYVFPGFGLAPNATAEQKHEAMAHLDQRLARYPSGLLMYFPAGARPLAMGRFLAVEFGTEFLESLLAVFLLAQTRLITFGARVGFVVLTGVLAAIATNISYWNWYGFPATYTAAYVVIQVIGFLCAGLVIALVLKNWKPADAF
jgi:hypothetical protein